MKSADHKSPCRFPLVQPRLGGRVYIDPTSHVSGSEQLGDDVSVWPMAVIRGDVNRIRMGARSNIQDGAIRHVTHESTGVSKGIPLLPGEDITVGHGAILHACQVNDCQEQSA